jgi:glycosyltransferase involved in cell wall biosynthesis
MKILVIEPCYVNFGGYFRAFNLSLALSKKGIQVDLLVSSNQKWKFSIKKTRISENFCQYELPRFDRIPYFNGRFTRAFIAVYMGIFKKYDVIHAFVPTQLEANIPAFFFKWLGKKVVIDWDDYWMGTSIFDTYPLIKRYVAFCEKKAPKFFENFTVVSVFLEDKAKKWGAKRILKIINGVNQGQFSVHTKEEGREKLKLDRHGKYLLAFGNNYAGDRGLLLLQTFEKIYELDPEVKLMFNFDPRKIIKDNQLEGKVGEECFRNIINVGYIEQENLGYYLGASDASIHLQGDTEDQRAGYPIRIGSYLNGEAVVVINDTNSEVGNILKQHKCAIIEKDIVDLARKTVEFLQNPALQKELRDNVIEAKKALSWNNLVVDLIEFYKQVMSVK